MLLYETYYNIYYHLPTPTLLLSIRSYGKLLFIFNYCLNASKRENENERFMKIK